MNYTFVSSSAEDTLNFGKKIAAQLHKKDVFVLTGELGSGKGRTLRRFSMKKQAKISP